MHLFLFQNAIFSNMQLFQWNKLCGPISYLNPPDWDFFSEEKQLMSHSKMQSQWEISNTIMANRLIQNAVSLHQSICEALG